MNGRKTLLNIALASALAMAFGAGAQNVSEGEIDQTTGQPRNAEQGGQANTNELNDPTAAQAYPGTASAENQGATSGNQSAGQSAQQSGQSGQSTDQSQQQTGERRPAEGPAQGQVGPPPNHSTTGETTGQGQGVKDSGGEAAAGTHEDQGGDPGRGATGHTGTGTGSSTEVKPQQSQ